jgi:hypothetical protein
VNIIGEKLYVKNVEGVLYVSIIKKEQNVKTVREGQFVNITI